MWRVIFSSGPNGYSTSQQARCKDKLDNLNEINTINWAEDSNPLIPTIIRATALVHPGFLHKCSILSFHSSSDPFNQLFIDATYGETCSQMNLGACLANIGGRLTPWPK